MDDPYVPPAAPVAPGVADAEALRRGHIGREATIRSIGLLYYLTSVLLLLGGVSLMVTGAEALDPVLGPVAGAGMLVVAVVYFVIGRGLRGLKASVRAPVAVLSALGLLSFPVGTAVNGLVLFAVFSPKGSVVFSPEYQAAIPLTPHVRYRTSPLVWVALGVLLALLAVLLFPVS